MSGVHSCTPLNLALTGKSTFVLKQRNLKIARLLIEHGANPNLRIPNHDLVSRASCKTNYSEKIIYQALSGYLAGG